MGAHRLKGQPICVRCAEIGNVLRRKAPFETPVGNLCREHHQDRLRQKKAAAPKGRKDRGNQLTGEQYEQLYLAQGGRCAICQTATGAARSLAIDHDHRTGEVRGLLCLPDNRMIGRLRDDAKKFRRAAEYLESPPARDVFSPGWKERKAELLREGDLGEGNLGGIA